MLIDTAKLTVTGNGAANPRVGDVLQRAEAGETVGELCARLERDGYGQRDLLDAIGIAVASGCAVIEWESRSPDLKAVLGGGAEAERICRKSPQWWNVLAYEREWAEYPEYNNFMSEGSPVYHKKKYQWEIYEGLLRKEIRGLAAGAGVLDVGGGVGRAAVPLAGRALDVTLVDVSPRALSAAWGHLSLLGCGGYDFALSDASGLGFIGDRTMSAALAIEVLCYVEKPEAALSEMVRCVRPGGWVAFSVENKLGALAADRHLELSERLNLLKGNQALVDGSLYVRYFSDEELLDMACGAGLKSVRLVKCHYVADGLLNDLARDGVYSDVPARNRFFRIEKMARELPIVKLFSRASLVVGVVG
jgi:SAM-dependent methyltransferase